MTVVAVASDVDAIWEYCQATVRDNPIVVVGSGLSASYGLPTMGDLAEVLKEIDVEHLASGEKVVWYSFVSALETQGLEQAIDSSNIWRSQGLYSMIRDRTWSEIVARENVTWQRCLLDRDFLSIGALINRLFRSDNRLVRVVTTNYDRLVEYACEQKGYYCDSGFQNVYFGRWRAFGDLHLHNSVTRARERTVELYKVHGSVDWFQTEEGTNVRFPLVSERIASLTPSIVPPSLQKYADTHNDPFRSVIQHVDRALATAQGFICIGYGFNDSHIQVKLLERARGDRKKILVLTRTMTSKLSELISTGVLRDYMVIERSSAGDGSIVHSSILPNSVFLEGQDVWSLGTFVNEVL